MFYGTNPILPFETENASSEAFELTARIRDDPDLVRNENSTTAAHLDDCTTRLLAMEKQKKRAVEILISTILKPIEQHELAEIAAAEEACHSDDA